MKAIIQKKIGKSSLTFHIDGEADVEMLAKAAFYASMPDTCGLCGSENVQLECNKAQQYTFIKIHCLKCNARSQMGSYKDLSGSFWKKFEIWNPDNAEGNEEPPQPTRTSPTRPVRPQSPQNNDSDTEDYGDVPF